MSVTPTACDTMAKMRETLCASLPGRTKRLHCSHCAASTCANGRCLGTWQLTAVATGSRKTCNASPSRSIASSVLSRRSGGGAPFVSSAATAAGCAAVSVLIVAQEVAATPSVSEWASGALVSGAFTAFMAADKLDVVASKGACGCALWSHAASSASSSSHSSSASKKTRELALESPCADARLSSSRSGCSSRSPIACRKSSSHAERGRNSASHGK
mmetsp:Transcript_24833/g.54261  ORF Transcript_24833/g.54261 Transcript_24833/m.54261 type:complete len:216 (-) Transcript_24833:243-890(-)